MSEQAGLSSPGDSSPLLPLLGPAVARAAPLPSQPLQEEVQPIAYSHAVPATLAVESEQAEWVESEQTALFESAQAEWLESDQADGSEGMVLTGFEQVADRLEAIARSLRHASPQELLASAGERGEEMDPLEILITGYALGYAQALRRGEEAPL